MKNMVGLGLPEYSFNTTHKAIIVGAGLSGCAIANALAQRGYRCALYDTNTSVAAGASALPAAVVRPAISGDAFYSTYFNHAFELCCNFFKKNFFNQCGALELTDNSLCRNTDNKYITDFFTAKQASAHAGTELNNNALHIKKAGMVVPKQLCDQWTTHPLIKFHPATYVCDLRQTEYGWQLIADNNTVIDESQLIILATAAATRQFNICSDVPLHALAGQIDRFEYQGSKLQCIVNGHGYLAPDTHVDSRHANSTSNATELTQSVWCGATHHRNATSVAATAVDTDANKATAAAIAPRLATASRPAASFAELRTFTPDRLPVVGAIPDISRYRTDYADLKHGKPPHTFPAPCFQQGLYIAAGLGSRGATQALLVGDLMASLIEGEMCGDWDTGRNSSQESDPDQRHAFCQALHPARFLVRALRRGL